MSAKIWAIGGGKGGTGKSLITSGLAIYLADIGKEVTLIDADLGGANLHSILKIKKPVHSLTDFFEKKITLTDIIEETGIPNLRLITGDIRSLTPDTLRYAQRLKLYRHIKSISSDYVLIDLGSGSALNTLDTFLLADKMITITLPEITSIDNLYHFLKKVLFRKLNVFLADHQLKDAAKRIWRNRKDNNIKTIKHLIDYFKGISGEVSGLIENEFSHFNVCVVVNQVRHDPHMRMGTAIKSVIIKYFGIKALYAGCIKYNETFWKYVDQSDPILKMTSAKPVMEEIETIAQNLMENKQVKLGDISYEVVA
jgi:flagellar biosynthesis protein FlhG